MLSYPRTQFVDEEGKPLQICDPGWDLQSDDPNERLRSTIGARHWVIGHLTTIATAPLALGARVRLVAYLGRVCVSSRDELGRELVQVGRRWYGRLSGRRI